jgi:hypothetical protein
MRNKPDVIISTYPIASAHIIAYVLHLVTGVPWVADLRDPMAQVGYPSDPHRKKLYEWIERKIVEHCSYTMVTAPGAKALYQQRFPEVDENFWQIIPNGYDETLFEQVKSPATVSSKNAGGQKRTVVLHSGLIYPDERDPSQLFSALFELRREGKLNIENLELRLRATGNDKLYQSQIEQLNIADIVTLEPPISYLDALEEMLRVDGLLLLQADNCNYQIPAKAYEYIRAQKPVLALTPPAGDTGRLLAKAGVADISPLDDKEKIKRTLLKFIDKLNKGEFVPMDHVGIQQYSRQCQAVKFRALLEKVIALGK